MYPLLESDTSLCAVKQFIVVKYGVEIKNILVNFGNERKERYSKKMSISSNETILRRFQKIKTSIIETVIFRVLIWVEKMAYDC